MESGRGTETQLKLPEKHIPHLSDDIQQVQEEVNAEDGDYCRICRGESSEEEPLFYPCKCSGSIKFVHQACLMEWLSHSQKKHCELCKTPFRFTKLYDPHMPGRLPTPIFLRQLVVHIAKALLTWSRFLLVTLVWLVWLPWSMRQVWRVMFYLVDCRWSAHLRNSSTDLSSPSTEASSFIPSAMVADLDDISFNMTAVNMLLRFVGTIFPRSLRWYQDIWRDYRLNASTDRQINPTAWKRSTILGDMSYLKDLTVSHTINHTVIDLLEGQMICLLLVVVSILLFLIREWVINQQPQNIPEADIAVAQGVNQLHAAVGQQPQEVNQALQQARDGPPAIAEGQPLDDAVENADFSANAIRESPGQPDEVAQNVGSGEIDSEANASVTHSELPLTAYGDRALPSPGLRGRPSLSGRNALDDATSIHRSIEEQGKLTSESKGWPGLVTFRDLWDRAEGNPSRVLKIIEQEGRQEELGWIVSQMERLQLQGRNNHSFNDAGQASNVSGFRSSQNRLPQGSDLSNHPSSGAVDLPQANHTDNTASTGSEKHTVPDSEANVVSLDHGSSGTTDAFETIDRSLAAAPLREESSTREEAHRATAEVEESSDSIVSEIHNSTLDTVMNWFWANDLYQSGEEDQPHQDDEHVIQDIEQEAPFVPVQHQQPMLEEAALNGANDPPNAPRDPEVVAAAAEAGIDLNNAEAVEDAEDLDGILELIGLQGPLTGLIQNVLFSQFLISLTLMAGIGIPYVWGMFALHVLSNPVGVFIRLPVAIVTTTIDLIVDTLLFSSGLLFYTIFSALSAATRLSVLCLAPTDLLLDVSRLPSLSRILDVSRHASASFAIASGSGIRLEKTLLAIFWGSGISLPNLTISAQMSLHRLEHIISDAMQAIEDFFTRLLLGFPRSSNWVSSVQTNVVAQSVSSLTGWMRSSVVSFAEIGQSLSSLLVRARSKGMEASISSNSQIEQEILDWTARDRTLAVALGYASIILLGFCYLEIARYIWKLKEDEKLEGMFADGLRQAGGVLKVILIIGIEMIVFPLYCGLLLDVALLPLFQNASLAGRFGFMVEAPLTTLFVHWFVGTCYMFHFALFVSMCRKNMRKGVLYFIRDPDDPTFHPVRDVLERSVATQLSKIAFSALIYGGLIILCLGGVVWGLSTIEGVLPVYWASGGPVIELPVDLIFYSFALPTLIRKVQPSEKISKIYEWWFYKVAGWLRLSDFLFGWKIASERGSRTWRDVFRGKEDGRILVEDAVDQSSALHFRDGRFVRTPASDSVRIPKGQRVFLEVNGANERVDGEPDIQEGAHGKTNPEFCMVYIPPHFRLRIALFVGHVWIFTAVVGVCVTIVPLVLGRTVIKTLSPSTKQANDLYALTVGVSLSLIGLYCLNHYQKFTTTIRSRVAQAISSRSEFLSKIWSAIKHAGGLVYLGFVFGLVLPVLFALVIECYIFVPVHTYLASNTSLGDTLRPPYLSDSGFTPTHTVYLVQAWVLGVLQLRLLLRLARNTPNERTLLATALRSITASPRHSLLNPSVSAATRAVILPSMLLSTFLLLAPLSLGYVINQAPSVVNLDSEVKAKIYRYSFPGLMAIAGIAWCAVLLQKAVENWRVRIRDEVYLVGERLHNFGERRSSSNKDKKGKGRATRSGSEGGVGGFAERRVAVL